MEQNNSNSLDDVVNHQENYGIMKKHMNFFRENELDLMMRGISNNEVPGEILENLNPTENLVMYYALGKDKRGMNHNIMIASLNLKKYDSSTYNGPIDVDIDPVPKEELDKDFYKIFNHLNAIGFARRYIYKNSKIVDTAISNFVLMKNREQTSKDKKLFSDNPGDLKKRFEKLSYAAKVYFMQEYLEKSKPLEDINPNYANLANIEKKKTEIMSKINQIYKKHMSYK